MTILIKSFNRPFYLDRCIYSAYKFVLGDFNIKILDDGSPEKYLDKIQWKYPHISIVKSDNYDEKSQAISENLKKGVEIINETLFNGDFDSLENFPKDFNLSYFEEFIQDKIGVDEFRKWVAHFKNQYQKLGADVN